MALGVRPAWAPDSAPAGPSPYVRRDIHDQVAAAAQQPGLVVIEGPSLVGKSRLAFEVMRQVLPDHRLAAPADPAAVRRLCAAAGTLTAVVVWLDGAERVLASGALDAAARAFAGTDVLLLATLDRRLVGNLDWDGSAYHHGADNPLIAGRVFHLAGELAGGELVRAMNYRADPRLAGYLDSPEPELGAFLAGGPQARRRWQTAQAGQHPTAGAVIRASVAAREHGFLGPLPRALLAELYPHYLPDGVDPDRSGLTAALEWAVQPAAPGGHGCLLPLPDGRYLPFSGLVDPRRRPLDRADPPLPVWRALLAHVEDGDARRLGVVIDPPSSPGKDPSEAELARIAQAAFRRAAEAGDRLAMEHLAVFLEMDQPDEAERWYRRAAEHGLITAAYGLGSTHRRARERLAPPPAGTAIDGDAMRLLYRFGVEGQAYEDVDVVGHAIRRAHIGDAGALYSIVEILDDLHDHDGTYADERGVWLRHAAERGHPAAMHRAGQAAEQGDQIEEATNWYRKAADGGHPPAMYDVARLYEDQGNRREAARWHQEGIKAGEARCLPRLGALLVHAGHPDKAEQLYQAALQHGHDQARSLLDELRRSRHRH